MSNWKDVELGDFLTFQRGFDIVKRDMKEEEGLYDVIFSSGVGGKHNEFKVKAPGVIVGRKGTLGSVFYSTTDFWPTDTTLWIKDFHGNNPSFAYYFLKTLRFEQYDCGSANPTLNRNHIHTLEIHIPESPQEQENIAAVLSCLDRKIENLRKQNETLERIAQNLFKHWFVDFEFPNEEGKPYKSSGGEMVRSELGKIPVDWKVGRLGELIEVNPRETMKAGSYVKYVDMKSLSTSSMEITGYITREFTSGSKFRNGDTLLARITPCLENGKTAFVNILDENDVAYGSTEFIVMRAKDKCCPEYVYCLSRNEYFREYAIKNMTGSSGRQRVPNDQVEDYELAIPELSKVKLFHGICKPLFFKIKSNQQQIQTLTKTRDVLLPKLMSGQLRITEGGS